MYEVRRAELCQEGGDHVTEEDDAFGDVGTDEVEGGGEDDNVEDIVDESWMLLVQPHCDLMEFHEAQSTRP